MKFQQDEVFSAPTRQVWTKRTNKHTNVSLRFPELLVGAKNIFWIVTGHEYCDCDSGSDLPLMCPPEELFCDAIGKHSCIKQAPTGTLDPFLALFISVSSSFKLMLKWCDFDHSQSRSGSTPITAILGLREYSQKYYTRLAGVLPKSTPSVWF